MNASLLGYVGLRVSYAFLHIVYLSDLVLLADHVVLVRLFDSQMFSAQDWCLDFVMTRDLLKTDVHNRASNLNNPGLIWLQFKLVLDLYQSTELRHVVLKGKFSVFEWNCSMRPWYADVTNLDLLIISTAQLVELVLRFWGQHVHQFTQVLF